MKIVCKKKNLSDGLTIVSRIISSGNALPVLNNTLLKTDKGRLKLSSTNLEMAINAWVGGKVEEEGEITIPAKVISEYIANLPAEKTTLTTEKENLSISTEKTKTHINGLSANEFPLIPDVGEEELVKLSANELKQAINEVVFSAAFSETQPEISGIFFVFEGNTLTLAATDRYRLAERKVKLSTSIPDRKKIIVPSRAVNEVARIIGDGEVTIFLGEGQILFRAEDVELTSRLIEGQYPDYEQILPKSFISEAVLSRDEFIRSLKAVSLFTAENNNIEFHLDPQKKQVQVMSESAQTGESEIGLEAEIIGEKNSIIFNYRYVLECLNNLPNEKIVLKMIDPTSPAAIVPEGRDDYLYIVMPIKI